MNNRIKIQAVWQPVEDGLALYMFQDNGAKRSLVESMQLREVQDGECWPEPSAKMTREDAQALADSLWDAGFRPTQGKMSVGAMDAQGAHLADMRAIAFAKLNVDAPR